MKILFKLFLIAMAISFGLLAFGCGPSTHVSVGVGVHAPGAWGGPYHPGAGVWMGTPVYPPYYYPARPGEEDEREFVLNQLTAPWSVADTLQTGAIRTGDF